MSNGRIFIIFFFFFRKARLRIVDPSKGFEEFQINVGVFVSLSNCLPVYCPSVCFFFLKITMTCFSDIQIAPKFFKMVVAIDPT